MKRIITWFLFETRAGDRLLHLLETRLGIGILPTESIDEVASALVCAVHP